MHDLRRLRAFHAVAERRSFSEAALALGYAQSVVSHHVAALEQEVGLTLVDRAGARWA
jgi:DNA-binding transcriptional LysR family regulator